MIAMKTVRKNLFIKQGCNYGKLKVTNSFRMNKKIELGTL
jgi:hypothetical protein